MKQHFCSAENSLIQYEKECNWCGEKEKEWVGLTDDEIEQGCKESWVTEQAWQSAVWWAEAKLKQKNGYAEEKNNGV